ncbi:Asp23/Gls24 family envelope stress response protein [Geodermatophilus nigrescens]
MTAVPTDPPPLVLADEPLPCGTTVDDLLARVTEGRPPSAHQRRCPHCRAGLAELSVLWAPVQDLAAEDVRAPAAVLEAVMDRVRELSRHPWHAVVPGTTGQTRIAARVVGAVARLAAQSVPQVTLALGRARRDAVEPAVGVAGTRVVVDIDIAVDYGAVIGEVARQVRAQITDDLGRHTGLTVAEVNVHVVDVLVTGARTDRPAR